MWLIYIPVWLQHFWLSINVKNLFFFLRTNPAIDGFILSDSKYRALQGVPHAYRPKAILLRKQHPCSEVLKAMNENEITFPVILKPDIGFRGLGVRRIDDALGLETALDTITVAYMLQEFISSPLEIGVFYYRYPNDKIGHIPSITLKEFLKVTGDGFATVESLVMNNPRARLVKRNLNRRFKKQWHTVLEKGQTLELECIGNHNRGTTFKNGNGLVDEGLLHVFDTLSHQMNGFYFGRFDVRATSLDAIKKGDYKILEVNGVGAEPTHIYDSNTPLLSMLRDLCFVWRVAAEIAAINFSLGTEKPRFKEAYTHWRAYCAYKAALLQELK